MARKLKEKDLMRYGSRTSAIKSDMDKPTASMKGLDEAVSKIGEKTKRGMSDAGSFGSAFKAARSSGDKTFTWRGKSFTTNVASSKPSAPVKRAAPATKPAAAPKPTAAAAKPAAAKPKYSAVDFKPTPKIKPAASDFSGPRIGRASALDTAKITGFPRYSASTPAKSSRPSVADVTRTDITGRKVELSPEKKRKLQEAIDRGGTRMAKGGSTQYPIRIDLDKAKRDTAARDEAKRRHGEQKKTMEKKYPFIKYDEPGNAKGGKVMKKSDKAGRALVKKSADTMGRAMKMNKGGKCYASGGSVSARADGIAKKGKTKTKQVAMKRGGMC